MASPILVFALGTVLGGTASGKRMTSTVSTAEDWVDITSMADRVGEAVNGKCCCDKAKAGVSGTLSNTADIAGKAADYVPFVGSEMVERGNKHTNRCVLVEESDLGSKNKYTGLGGGCGSLPKSFRTWSKNAKLHDYTKTEGQKCEVSKGDLKDLYTTFGATVSCKEHGVSVACGRLCTGTAMDGAGVMEGKEGDTVKVSCPTGYVAKEETVKCKRDGKFSPRPKCVKG